jgi:triphosphoribosyl-dephospho-CoA synthase
MTAGRCFAWACALDVAAPKPGNVSAAAPGHRMQAGDFLLSAAAAAPFVAADGARVGERIEGAIRATRECVAVNTNLGIVLLAAPLLAAAEAMPSDAHALRGALRRVLAGLDVEDARAAYRAIALASPGGLGRADEQDVRAEPTVDLLAAMTLAAGRDRIARQYASAFEDVFERGLPAFADSRARALAAGASPAAAARAAMLRCHLEFLAAFPDSHIVRGRGDAPAHSVMAEAAPWLARARRGDVQDDPALLRWDAALKARGLNPGTTADLCVACALASALAAPELAEVDPA